MHSPLISVFTMNPNPEPEAFRVGQIPNEIHGSVWLLQQLRFGLIIKKEKTMIWGHRKFTTMMLKL
jgi:hypothetical protein